jgi:membrane-associated phospholipid phosphatase
MDESRVAPAASSSRVAVWRAQWLVPGGLVLLLAFLTASVLAHGPLDGVDRRVRDAVQTLATSAGWRWLSAGRLAPAQLITDLGSAEIAGVVLAVAALAVAVRRRSLRPVLTAAAGGALLAATVIPGKILIGRPGPGFATLPPGGWGDFPSGHASTACVCYGLAVLLLTSGRRSGHLRRSALAVMAAVCFLVGVALVWCDYHWFTDVVAGWALGTLIVWVVWHVQERAGAAGPVRGSREHGVPEHGVLEHGVPERRNAADDRARA